MSSYQIKIYNPTLNELWNSFISNSKNATFLFHRDFMEYHEDRFDDYSLLVFDDKENLVSVLPANRVGETLFSHQGLTYGGFVFTKKTKLTQAIEIVHDVLKYLDEEKITSFNVKEIPSIYTTLPSDELDYICYLLDAKTVRKDSLSVIDLSKSNKITNSRKKNSNRGKKHNLIIREEADFELFWNEILLPNLDNKHQSKPVHSVEEILYLKSKFPENIRHFNVFDKDKIVAGTTMFLAENVAKPQYISGNEDKNELGSIDFLYAFLIEEFKDKNYFDFGPSNENDGRKIKEGILFWKESFGARTQVQNFFEIQTENYVKLENILI